MNRWATGILAAALLASGPGCSAAPEAQTPETWTVEFPTSGAGEAQQHFIRGLTAMHLFMYPDAVKAFQAAQQADPKFAMAYWGEALTHYRPIWREYERDEARAVLQKLAPTAEGRAAAAPTDREKAYLRTLKVLYAQKPLAERFAERLRDTWREADAEVAALAEVRGSTH